MDRTHLEIGLNALWDTKENRMLGEIIDDDYENTKTKTEDENTWCVINLPLGRRNERRQVLNNI